MSLVEKCGREGGKELIKNTNFGLVYTDEVDTGETPVPLLHFCSILKNKEVIRLNQPVREGFNSNVTRILI